MTTEQRNEFWNGATVYAHQSLPVAILFGLLPNGCGNGGRVYVILMDQKLIWALCFDIPWRKCQGRKIFEVECDDGLRTTGYGG